MTPADVPLALLSEESAIEAAEQIAASQPGQKWFVYYCEKSQTYLVAEVAHGPGGPAIAYWSVQRPVSRQEAEGHAVALAQSIQASQAPPPVTH